MSHLTTITSGLRARSSRRPDVPAFALEANDMHMLLGSSWMGARGLGRGVLVHGHLAGSTFRARVGAWFGWLRGAGVHDRWRNAAFEPMLAIYSIGALRDAHPRRPAWARLSWLLKPAFERSVQPVEPRHSRHEHEVRRFRAQIRQSYPMSVGRLAGSRRSHPPSRTAERTTQLLPAKAA